MKSLAVAVMAAAAFASSQQTRQTPLPPPTGSASLSGTLVTDEAAPVPIRRAHVTLNSSSPSVGRTTITDDSGRFAFTSLPAASYMLSAAKAAFVSTTYGAKRPGRPGTPLAITEAQRLTGVVLRMIRGAVIEGTAVDQNGDPAAGRTVTLRQYRVVNGTRSLAVVASGGDSRTDDRGHYRLFGLAPGDYIVSVEPVTAMDNNLREVAPADVARASAAGRAAAPPFTPGPLVGFAPIFYPGTTVALNATPINVSAGDERTGIDLRLALLPMSTVTVAVTRSDGPLPTSAFVSLTPLGTGLAVAGQTSLRPTGATGGVFSATAVAPGQYELTAEGRNLGGRASAAPTTSEGRQGWWASSEVTVGGGAVSFALKLEPEPSVSGRLVFEGTAPRPADLTRVWVNFIDARTGSGWARPAVSAEGTFKEDAMRPGRYRITGAFAPGVPNAGEWALKSAVFGGRDIADELDIRAGQDLSDLVVTFTDRQTELAGTLQDASGRAVSDYFIVVFASNRAVWVPQSRWIAETRPSSDGRFTIHHSYHRVFTGGKPGHAEGAVGRGPHGLHAA